MLKNTHEFIFKKNLFIIIYNSVSLYLIVVIIKIDKYFRSNQLKTTSNVGLYIVQENIWRTFPIKSTKLV